MYYKTGVDISNAKQMWNFLKGHYQYYTMNSWNGLKSIANNVKVYNLKLDGDYSTALSFLFDESDVGGLNWQIREFVECFEAEHPGTIIFHNGRSGGYLVLGNRDNNKSILPDYVEDYDTYEDFKSEIKEFYHDSVKDYLYELRHYTKLVQDFDKLCDQLRDLVNEYSKMCYEDLVLVEKVALFNDLYDEDLESLGYSRLEVKNNLVDVSEICQLSCLKEALLRLFNDSNNYEAVIEDDLLRVKEA